MGQFVLLCSFLVTRGGNLPRGSLHCTSYDQQGLRCDPENGDKSWKTGSLLKVCSRQSLPLTLTEPQLLWQPWLKHSSALTCSSLWMEWACTRSYPYSLRSCVLKSRNSRGLDENSSRYYGLRLEIIKCQKAVEFFE
jgi:hypothetical protein